MTDRINQNLSPQQIRPQIQTAMVRRRPLVRGCVAAEQGWTSGDNHSLSFGSEQLFTEKTAPTWSGICGHLDFNPV